MFRWWKKNFGRKKKEKIGVSLKIAQRRNFQPKNRVRLNNT